MKKPAKVLICLVLFAVLILSAVPAVFADSMKLTLTADRTAFEQADNNITLKLSFNGQELYPGVDASVYLPDGIEVVSYSSDTSTVKQRADNRIQFLFEDVTGKGIVSGELGTITVKLSSQAGLTEDYLFTFAGEGATSDLKTVETGLGNLNIKGRMSNSDSFDDDTPSSDSGDDKTNSDTASSQPAKSDLPKTVSSVPAEKNGADQPISAVTEDVAEDDAVLFAQPGIRDEDEYLSERDVQSTDAESKMSTDNTFDASEIKYKDDSITSSPLFWIIIGASAVLCAVLLIVGILIGKKAVKNKIGKE